MAVIRLEFDIDSDVHPELHAMLSTIASLGARGERLRQLAATGLVWERTRLESLPPAPLHAAARPAAMKPMVTAPVAAALSKAMPKKKPAFGAVRSSFVDLAIDAARGPSSAPVDPLALREFEDEIERVVSELPELFDVLEPGEYTPVPALPPARPPVPPPMPRLAPYEPPMSVEADALALHDGLAEVDPPRLEMAPPQAEPESTSAAAPGGSQREEPARDAADALAAEAPSPAPVSTPEGTLDETSEPAPPVAPKRTRLQRMKEKGLFKNE